MPFSFGDITDFRQDCLYDNEKERHGSRKPWQGRSGAAGYVDHLLAPAGLGTSLEPAPAQAVLKDMSSREERGSH
jgi:hypothetical protein